MSQKIVVTAQQRANAIEARDVMWPSVPPENVAPNLSIWRRDKGGPKKRPDCGSVACFGGWCAAWPPFVKQGVRTDISGAPMHGKEESVWLASAHLFGEYIFDMRGDYPPDREFTGSDHELVTHRLNWLIENSVVQA